MSVVRVPVEYDLGPELPTVRGFRAVPSEPPLGRVLCLHDLGRDVDELGPLPTVIAAGGFVAEAVDLPGHGLSDGDDSEPATIVSTVRALLPHLRRETPILGLVAVGRSATMSAALGEADGVIAQVVISPVLDDRFPDAVRARSTRLVVQGEDANLVGTNTQRYFSHVLGEKLLVYNPSVAQGAAMVANVDAVATHVVLFLRRYLTPGPRPARSVRAVPVAPSPTIDRSEEHS